MWRRNGKHGSAPSRKPWKLVSKKVPFFRQTGSTPRPTQNWRVRKENLRLKWAATEMGSAEYMSIGRELFDVYVKKIIKLGLVGQVPDVMIAKNGLGNVVPPKWVTGYPLDPQLIQEWYDQLFWKE